jgi:hypothetical protein
MKCLICNKILKSHQSFCLHLRIHDISINDYSLNFLKLSNKCKVCNNTTKYSTQKRAFSDYCSSKCAGISPDTKYKRQQTCITLYGVDSVNKVESIKEQRKLSNLEKYGVVTNLNLPHQRRQTTEAIITNKDIINTKRTITNLEKYGTVCTLNTPASIIKKKKTWMTNYGVEHPQQSQIIRDKTEQTCIEKYGVSSPFKSKIIHDKILQTNLDRYGVMYTSQRADINSKVLGSLFRCKPYILPSGKVINLLGYEPYLLDFIFANKLFLEDEIDYKPNKIKYTDNGKIRYYFPDFYIPKLNLIIEVKSKWTEKQDKNLLLKEQACIDNNFKYIRVINNNFEDFLKYVAHSNT